MPQCHYCGGEFRWKRRKRFCAYDCRMAYHRDRRRSPNGQATGIGAFNRPLTDDEKRLVVDRLERIVGGKRTAGYVFEFWPEWIQRIREDDDGPKGG